MQCWICGGNADSGEHIIKVSDLKMIFGKVKQEKPIYMHTKDRRNQRVAGLSSDKLKYGRVMCRDCNSSRTQKSDLAWAQLSTALRALKPAITEGQRFRLAKVFPGSVSEKMTQVQLFFVKQLGCLIKENDIPIDIEGFSRAVISGRAHPDIYLRFLTGLQENNIRLVSRSPVQVASQNGKVMVASFIYMIDRVAVSVIYIGSENLKAGYKGAFHPLHGTRVIRFEGVGDIVAHSAS